MAHYNKIKN